MEHTLLTIDHCSSLLISLPAVQVSDTTGVRLKNCRRYNKNYQPLNYQPQHILPSEISHINTQLYEK